MKNCSLQGHVSGRIQKAVCILVDAQGYALDAGVDPWEFAVEIDLLRSEGLNRNDLRWLRTKGYVEKAREVTGPGDTHREFRPCSDATFSERTCFILTPAGAEFAQQTADDVLPIDPVPRSEKTLDLFTSTHIPCWDKDRRQLLLNGDLVKRFRVPAANQELILDAFQEDAWPNRVDDPLPPSRQMDPKRRLHAAINSLNRNQKKASIRFYGDGRGDGICWELLSPTKS